MHQYISPFASVKGSSGLLNSSKMDARVALVTAFTPVDMGNEEVLVLHACEAVKSGFSGSDSVSTLSPGSI